MDKLPITFKQQMELLRSRGIIIGDEDSCINTLENLNYYRLSAYMLPYKIKKDEYAPVAFETIYHIYEFDRKLRVALLTVLEEVELRLRTKLAYYHAHIFGALGYLDEKNYNKSHKHDAFIDEFYKIVERNKDVPFVKHHITNKSGRFPIWVAVELFPFGMLSRFYADMPVANKKDFAVRNLSTGYQQLESWLLCLSTLRNKCAHYARLYNFNFSKWPATPKDSTTPLKNKVFDYIYVLRYLYPDANKWQSGFIRGLETLIENNEQHINLCLIGFPDNWKSALNSTK